MLIDLTEITVKILKLIQRNISKRKISITFFNIFIGV